MSLNRKERIEILTALKNQVLKHHFNVARVDQAAWVNRVDECMPVLLSGDKKHFEGAVRDLIAELGSSHTAFYHERTNRFTPQHTINATLRSFNIDGEDRWVFLDVFEAGSADKAGIKPGDVLVTVRDLGVGLGAEPNRIFTAFYTTKTNGMGMGLPICRTIIEAHHGRLWAENRPEGGASFRFTLPIAAEGATK